MKKAIVFLGIFGLGTGCAALEPYLDVAKAVGEQALAPGKAKTKNTLAEIETTYAEVAAIKKDSDHWSDVASITKTVKAIGLQNRPRKLPRKSSR